MKSLTWYLHRLRAMSLSEVGWRAESAFRDRVDACRIVFNALPRDPLTAREAGRLAVAASPLLTDLARGCWRDAAPGTLEQLWRQRLLDDADAIVAHRVRIFGTTRDLGAPIAWNREHEQGLDTPLNLAFRIDYRDRHLVGDAKVVWEPNRHHHLVTLARAYRVSGDSRYAAAVVTQLTSWLDQSPFGRGMNWRSPLELAIRLINWTWALDLIRDSSCLSPEFCRRVLTAVHLHLWEITRKFSRGSSANNHLIGEAAGVFVACSYFHGLRDATAWRAISAAILADEIAIQTHADGGTREQAMAYHLFVLQLHLVAGISGRSLGRELPTRFWTALERMTDFAAALAEGGSLPAFGDADDGYVLDLGRDGDDVESTLCAAAVLFKRGDYKSLAGTFREPVRWLLGGQSVATFAALGEPAERPLRSHALADSGYYVLQTGTRTGGNVVSAVFDCGPLGFTRIAAHGHADALSVVIRAFGREFLVDPGTYDYFAFPQWREYYRSTRSHNTVVVDDVDQSVQLGLFLWGAKAEASCLAWTPRDDGAVVVGEHTGYRRLHDPVTHRRTVELDGTPAVVRVRDDLSMNRAHRVQLHFHLAADCEVVRLDAAHSEIAFGGHLARVQLDPRGDWTLLRGSERPIGGWVSRGYHQRQPAVTIVGAFKAEPGASILTQFEFVPGASSSVVPSTPGPFSRP